MGKKANKKINDKVIHVLEQAFNTKGYGILKEIDTLLLSEQGLKSEVASMKLKYESEEQAS